MVGLCILYILNTHIKFCTNQILFTVQFITYFLYIILNYKILIDNIVIDLWSFEKFANIKDIRRKCNLIVDLSKFTSNKKILSEVIV